VIAIGTVRSKAVLSDYLLILAYLGITAIGGGRAIYDRLAGTSVVKASTV